MQNLATLATQYQTDHNLRVRIQTHERYTVGPAPEPAVDKALALRGDEDLLDVGTGRGDFPGRLRAGGHRGRLVGVDLSEGMVAKARTLHRAVEFMKADAAALPFPDASFDVLTARHMLFHVSDVPAALAEFWRVLRPGGRFLAVTNSADNMAAFWDAIHEAVRDDPQLAPFLGERASAAFCEVNGEPWVREAFGNARVEFVDAALVFPDPEPVLRYFDTLHTLHGVPEALQGRAREALRRVLPPRFRSGPWRVSKRLVLIMTTKSPEN
jgi:SAM-dependent methyltransferase